MARRAQRILPVGFLLFLSTALAQTLGPIKGFKLAEAYDAPNQSQLKFLIEGTRAEILDKDRTLITTAKLQTFRIDGEAEFLVTTPQCVHNAATESIGSPGPLRVQTADGKFTIEGEGFLWKQTNSSLIISNRVHTIIEPTLLEGTATNEPVSKTSGGSGQVHIYSDRFVYDANPGLGLYSGNVRVTGTNRDLSMTTEVLRVKVPAQERQFQTITAETNVVIDYAGLHGTGQWAEYSASNGIARLRGHPTWRAGLREGRGDELVIDRTNRLFQANGNAWMKVPGASLGPATFLLSTNSSSPQEPTSTNQVVEVWSDHYEFRTNWGVFGDRVRVHERQNNQDLRQMTCRLLTVTLAGTNELQTLEADGNVVIDQETNRLGGGKAIYTATNGLLEMTQKPYWQSGLRNGRGDKLEITRDQMLVIGNASMRLPAEELAQSPTSGTNQPQAKASSPQFADIYSQEYTLWTNRAVFRGGIYVTHPQMNLVCEKLEAQLGSGEGKTVTAEQGVVFDLKDERGQTLHGAGNKAVYTVGFSGDATNGLLRLTGTPAMVQSTNGLATSSVLLLNRATGDLSAPGGDYHLQGTGPALNTNRFELPKPRISK